MEKRKKWTFSSISFAALVKARATWIYHKETISNDILTKYSYISLIFSWIQATSNDTDPILSSKDPLIQQYK